MNLTSFAALVGVFALFAAPPTEDDAQKIALARVPGKVLSVKQDGDDKPFLVRLLDKKGRESFVSVHAANGAVLKVVTARITRKDAMAIAVKRAGAGHVADEEISAFDPARQTHLILVLVKNGQFESAQTRYYTIEDRTGKVLKIEDISGRRVQK